MHPPPPSLIQSSSSAVSPAATSTSARVSHGWRRSHASTSEHMNTPGDATVNGTLPPAPTPVPTAATGTATSPSPSTTSTSISTRSSNRRVRSCVSVPSEELVLERIGFKLRETDSDFIRDRCGKYLKGDDEERLVQAYLEWLVCREYNVGDRPGLDGSRAERTARVDTYASHLSAATRETIANSRTIWGCKCGTIAFRKLTPAVGHVRTKHLRLRDGNNMDGENDSMSASESGATVTSNEEGQSKADDDAHTPSLPTDLSNSMTHKRHRDDDVNPPQLEERWTVARIQNRLSETNGAVSVDMDDEQPGAAASATKRARRDAASYMQVDGQIEGVADPSLMSSASSSAASTSTSLSSTMPSNSSSSTTASSALPSAFMFPCSPSHTLPNHLAAFCRSLGRENNNSNSNSNSNSLDEPPTASSIRTVLNLSNRHAAAAKEEHHEHGHVSTSSRTLSLDVTSPESTHMSNPVSSLSPSGTNTILVFHPTSALPSSSPAHSPSSHPTPHPRQGGKAASSNDSRHPPTSSDYAHLDAASLRQVLEEQRELAASQLMKARSMVKEYLEKKRTLQRELIIMKQEKKKDDARIRELEAKNAALIAENRQLQFQLHTPNGADGSAAGHDHPPQRKEAQQDRNVLVETNRRLQAELDRLRRESAMYKAERDEARLHGEKVQQSLEEAMRVAARMRSSSSR